jgi:hypothetical protein
MFHEVPMWYFTFQTNIILRYTYESVVFRVLCSSVNGYEHFRETATVLLTCPEAEDGSFHWNICTHLRNYMSLQKMEVVVFSEVMLHKCQTMKPQNIILILCAVIISNITYFQRYRKTNFWVVHRMVLIFLPTSRNLVSSMFVSLKEGN